MLFLVVITRHLTLHLEGSVKGLKKGTFYLQRQGDSALVNLDSMEINGQDIFNLSTRLTEPELLYLKLFKNDNEEHYIPFFAAEGETVINTSLTNFNFDARIEGSQQQKLLNEYNKTIADFNNRNLELIKASLLAQQTNATSTIDSIADQSDNLLKRQYAYTINFALTHKESEVAPFLAVYEIPDANIKYLDTIYKALTPTIKSSLYGKALRKVIDNKQR